MKNIGTTIIYNGKINQLIYDGECKEYAVGNLICEYARFEFAELKRLILNYIRNDDLFNKENVCDAIEYVMLTTKFRFGMITSSMITTVFIHAWDDLLDSNNEMIQNHLNELNQTIENDSLIQFIFNDTQKNCFELNTIEDAMLYAYYVFLIDYSIFKESFNKIMLCGLEGNKEESVNAIFSIFTNNSQYQKIDYRIVSLEGTITNVYTIKNSISLLAFELAHISEVDPIIIKCKNCGHYFVSKRIDSIYCSYPYKNNKTCKEIGAQKTRKQKEKEDVFTNVIKLR